MKKILFTMVLVSVVASANAVECKADINKAAVSVNKSTAIQLSDMKRGIYYLSEAIIHLIDAEESCPVEWKSVVVSKIDEIEKMIIVRRKGLK